MLNKETLQTLSARLADIFPAADGIRRQLESDIQDVLQSSFSKLNLLTREEFEQQISLLKRMEQTITELESKIQKLEEQIGKSSTKDHDQTSDS